MENSENGNTPSQPTSGKAWRKPSEEGYLVTLTSGNVARIRTVSLEIMIKSGNLPDILTPIAAKMLYDEMEAEQIGELTEMAVNLMDLADIVCKAAFLEPRVVDEPAADNELGIDDIEFTDKMAVFQLAIQPSVVLEKFREEQARDVALVLNSEDDADKAE